MTPSEAWRTIDGYEGYYEVSNLGRVRSLPRRGSRGGILKASLSEGYPSVGLFRGGVGRSKRIHTLVAAAFLGPRPDGMDVCHGNGDRTDNRLENLRYGTRSENLFDTVRHGRHAGAIKTECLRGHPFTPENTYIFPKGGRKCRTCSNASSRRSTEKRRAS